MEEASLSFFEWLTSCGAQIRDPRFCKIALHHFKRTGRGCIATHCIEVDATIVEIPIAAIICETNLARCPAAQCISTIVQESRAVYDATGSNLRHFSKFLSLALLLAFEKRNPDSYWKCYIRMLPQAFDLPIFWLPEERALLQGTLIEQLVSFSESSLYQLMNEVVEPFSALYSATTGSKSDISFDDVKWAFACIWSRGYWLDECENEPCLVPLADMLNHTPAHRSAGGVATYGFDKTRGVFRIASRVQYSRGDEVLTYYGDKTNYEFLNDYGFLIEADNDRRRELLLNLPIWILEERQDPKLQEKKVLLHRVGLSALVAYLGGQQGHLLVIACRILCMSDEEVDTWYNDMNGAVLLQQNRPVAHGNEIGAVALLLDICATLRSKFPTSASEDAGLLCSQSISYRERCAIEYRREEKQLIWRAEQYFQKYLDALLCDSPFEHTSTECDVASMFKFR
eukprot:TRINITY_DN829_c0_g1_i1.p1 TRINITY_DN829_c0_g1~~TRINITY_DN829_c0_g1_i1.p1  ORF type:complete len:456 (-),score=38.37 TRINITY_DN829_c0_g1_i1:1858-3225(-)